MKAFKDLSKEEIIDCVEKCKSYNETLIKLGCHANTINRKKLRQFVQNNNVGISHFVTKLTKEQYEASPKQCKFCGKIITWKQRANDFCNHSCSASYNNSKIHDDTHKYFCLNCGKEIANKNKFCNQECASTFHYKEYIRKWKVGEESGTKGKNDVSSYIRKYLFEKYDGSCQICGWRQQNIYTNLVPLQIHHIDGDCMNNREDNLQLLCPNCHSLTENFGSRNHNCTRKDDRIR